MNTVTKNVSQISPHQMQFINAPNFVSLYTNNIGLSMSTFDLSLIFGELTEATAEIATVERKARVTMSHLQAKILLAVLAQQLQVYETQNGPIPIPPGLEELIPVNKGSRNEGESK
jgi:hypothetical protein